jgi:beta-lactamase regulating signal transducer with metallopeptidase domain
MISLDLFLSQSDFIADVFSSTGVRFLWQSSALIIAAWGICRILGNESPRIKSVIWTITLLMVPLLPLLSTTMNANTGWDINIKLDSGAFTDNNAHEQTEEVVESDQSLLQPLLTKEPATESSINLMEYKWAIAFLAYLLVFLAMFTVFIVKIICVYRWRIKGCKVTDSFIIKILKNHIGINRSVKIFQSDEIPTPMVIGIFAPAILLPSTLLEDFDKKTLDVVLAHECAHIARKDNLVLLYASLVQTVLFFHPLIWFAVNELALSIEEAADFAVMEKTEIKAQNYASVLFGMAVADLAPVTSLPFSRNHNLLTRITSILNSNKTATEELTMNRIKKYFLLAVIGVILVFCQLVNINCGTQKTKASTQASLKPSEIYMTVFGKVLDPDGNPAAGVAVYAVPEKPGPESFNGFITGDCRFMVVSDSDGNFRISYPKQFYMGSGFKNISFPKRVRGTFLRDGVTVFFRDGGIVLEAHAGNKWIHAADHRWLPNLANGLSQPIKLTRGTVGPVTIRLTKGATISGTVYDGENRPMSKQKVGISYHDCQSNRYFRPTAITDEEGRFTMKNIRPGKIWLTASQPYLVFDVQSSKSPFPENTAIILDVTENARIDGLKLRGMTHEENEAIYLSYKLRERRKFIQVY